MSNTVITAPETKTKKNKVSTTRKIYIFRLIARCLIVSVIIYYYFTDKSVFDILNGFNFFKSFSPFHLLWALFMFDMLCQVFPIKNHISIGSQKLFKEKYIPNKKPVSLEKLKEYVKSTTTYAYKVMILWILLLIAIAVLYYTGIIGKIELFMITCLFYIADLVCVLIWCPFRLLIKARCCTTCRIFNWDHFFMFSPIMFIGSFFAQSLFIFSLVVIIIWEVFFFIHPERFWDRTNYALQCSQCTDKLCTQICQRSNKRKKTS